MAVSVSASLSTGPSLTGCYRLAHIVGRPVRNGAGTRIGRVSDIVVRWDAANEHPPVTGVFVKVRGALAAVRPADVN